MIMDEQPQSGHKNTHKAKLLNSIISNDDDVRLLSPVRALENLGAD